MAKICEMLHEWAESLQEFSFPYEDHKIPLNGIYLLFEKGEQAHGTKRIVRVGTHTGKNQLRSRLCQHFVNENKDRSIFRKNIGRALLGGDAFLQQWEIDLTTKAARQKHSGIDVQKQKEIEHAVTMRLQDRFTFVVLRVDDAAQRKRLESRIISAVSLCNDCTPSATWLGLQSPKPKIRESGLWLEQELYKEPLTAKELDALKLSYTNTDEQTPQ